MDDTMEHAIGARKEDAVLSLLSRMVSNLIDPDVDESFEPEYPVGELIDFAIEVRIDANGLIENIVPSFYYKDGKRKLPYWVGLLTKGFERNR